MRNQENQEGQLFKVEYKIIYNREARNPNAQNKISKTKEFLSLNHTSQTPYFCSIGFVGGETLQDVEQTSFNITIFIRGVKNRHSLNAYILKVWKGSKVYIFENNSIPYLLQG